MVVGLNITEVTRHMNGGKGEKTILVIWVGLKVRGKEFQVEGQRRNRKGLHEDVDWRDRKEDTKDIQIGRGCE